MVQLWSATRRWEKRAVVAYYADSAGFCCSHVPALVPIRRPWSYDRKSVRFRARASKADHAFLAVCPFLGRPTPIVKKEQGQSARTGGCCTNCCTHLSPSSPKRTSTALKRVEFITTYARLGLFVIGRSSLQVRSSAPSSLDPATLLQPSS
jgi:hypothetical protein